MEAFNKNWLAIVLIAVVFGTLGFLLGRTTGHAHLPERKVTHTVYREHVPGDSVEVEVRIDAQGAGATMRTDTIISDGKTIIIQEVSKIKP